MVPMSDEQRNDDRPQGLCGKGSQSGSGLSGSSGLGSGDNPPYAKQEPHRRIEHGDVFDDPYEWMRDKDSPELAAYVAAQNAYCDRRMAPLHHLRETLFKEFTSHVQETDMSVPTRVNDYWYFSRTREGSQYAASCRIPVRGEDDWDPPHIDREAELGSMPGEQVYFDANKESQGHDFFRIGGMDVSHDGRWLLYGVDTAGDERYDFRIRDLNDGNELPEVLKGIAGACFTADGAWVFYTVLDDAWRPYAVFRHRVGTPVDDDVEVFREQDERFWVGVGLSFDERHVVICTGSKTTSEVLMLPANDPTGEFTSFIPRREGIEYDVSFACFEGAGEHGEDIPVAVVDHNATNPNFEIDVIDMRSHKPPYRLGEGVCVAAGSPYGCEQGDVVLAGASDMPVGTPYHDPRNPTILQGARGLSIDGIALHRYFVALSYRADSLPHLAVMAKTDAAQDFLAGRPWRFRELVPPPLAEAGAGNSCADGTNDGADDGGKNGTSTNDGVSDDTNDRGNDGRLYSIGAAGNPSYDAPRMRYSFGSYTRPGELHEIDPATGADTLLKRARVLGDFDAHRYAERRIWVRARDGESIPVSLVWRRDKLSAQPGESACYGIRADGSSPMFILGYGAYEVSSDPGFSVARLSLLDRGVLYACVHVRGGGEMGRAWYEQGRRLNKKHTFEDFVDATRALQRMGLASPARTVAEGGSAGGLLMGAIANMAPECYAGIEADVPFVDALTSILDPSLPLTVTEWDEWGDPLHDRAVYEYMKSYSPYENAPEPGDPRARAFPKIFVTTSMNDTRVLVVEPLKWVARLQAAGVDAVEKIETEAGHGGTSGRYRQWREISYENAWCLATMGITR